MKTSTIVLIGAGIAGYLFLSKSAEGEGTGGSLSIPEFEGLMGNGESQLLPGTTAGQTIPLIQQALAPLFVDANPAVTNLLKTGLTDYKAVGEYSYTGMRNGYAIEGDLTAKKIEINPMTQQAFTRDTGGKGNEVLYTEKSKIVSKKASVDIQPLFAASVVSPIAAAVRSSSGGSSSSTVTRVSSSSGSYSYGGGGSSWGSPSRRS